MRLLDRYLLREFLFWLVIFFVGFLLAYIMFELFLELHKLQEAHLRPKEVVEYCVYTIPEFMPVALPVSLLLALLYALTNHARYNEITAMRAAGISLGRLCVPYFMVGLLASVGLFAFDELFSVRAAASMGELMQRHGEVRLAPAQRNVITNLIFVNAGVNGQDREWTMLTYNTKTFEMERPHVSRAPTNGGPRLSLLANKAVWTNHEWLFSGDVLETMETTNSPRILSTNALAMPEFTETPGQIQSDINIMGYYNSHINARTHNADVPLKDILNYLRWHPHPERKMRNWIYTKLHGRFAGPFACLVVVFVAIPFSAGSGRRNVFVGVATSITIFFAYFVLLQVGFSLGEAGWLPPWFGAWFPNLFFTISALLMISKVR